MARKRYKPEEIVAKLRQFDFMPLAYPLLTWTEMAFVESG